ncbi:MAG: DUF1570 domain-containing protein [Planctomycetota bacterium]
MAVVAIVFATMGKGDGGSGDNGNGTAQNTGRQDPPPVKEKTPREKFDEAMAEADETADKATKVARLEEAVYLLDRHGFADTGHTTEELYQKLVEVEPDHADARNKLGYFRYTGPYEKYSGKWLTKDELAKANQEYREFAAAEEARKTAEAEKARWDKDAWTKKCARVRDHFVKDVSPVPDFELVFFFDMPEVPRPYLLMIEKTENPSPEASAKDYGPGLATLRATFARAYNDGTLADWDETTRVVPILMFASRQSYYKYRDNGHEDLPKSDFIGAFYKHVAPEGMEELFRGCLYVWQGENAKEFTSTLFHEATHQLMHNGCQDAKMADSPWLEEGMAEYWSGYDGNKYAGFKFGRLQDGRWRNCQQIAENYYQRKNGAETFVMTPKDLLEYSNQMFNADRSGLNGGIGSTRVSLTYALGWGFIHFCYNFEQRDKPGTYPYRDVFEKMLKDELRYQLTPAKAVEYMGIKDEAGWDQLSDDFFFYIKRTLRGMKGKEYHPGGKEGEDDGGD